MNTKKIAIIHGPNLNMLGMRETSVYGHMTLSDIDHALRQKAQEHHVDISIYQSNIEGDIVSHIHTLMSYHGIIINPAAYTHTSVAIRDALLAINVPTIEVHLSNIHKREEFRHHSYISDIAIAQISGLGHLGYLYALEYFAQQ